MSTAVPMVPGLYVDAAGDVIRVRDDGSMVELVADEGYGRPPDLPLTRLVPDVGSAVPEEIVRILRDTYKDIGIRIWWQSRNRWLDGVSPRETWPVDPDAVLVCARRIEGY